MEYAFGRVLNPLGACSIQRISKLLVHHLFLYNFVSDFRPHQKDHRWHCILDYKWKGKTCQGMLVVVNRLLWCVLFMSWRSWARLVNSWARVVCVLIISCVAERVHVQRDNSALRNCTFLCCDVQYCCRTCVSGILIFTFVSSARVHEKVTWFQRHVTPSRESRDASTFTSPESWPQVVKWLERHHKSCPRSPQHEKNAPLFPSARAGRRPVIGWKLLGGPWPLSHFYRELSSGCITNY